MANSMAMGAPTAAHDSSLGFEAGSNWIDLTTGLRYVCSSAAPGAAVWSLQGPACGTVGLAGHLASTANPHGTTASQVGAIPTGDKGAASGVASLDSSSKVVQDPANATATPAAGKIPIADGSGKLDAWITQGLSSPGVLYRREMQVLVNPGATTITVVGLTTGPTLTPTLSSVTDTDGPYLQHASSNVNGNPTGVISAFTICRRDWQPKFGALVRTSTPITLQRIWVGLFSASPDASATPAIHLAAFRYDTTADGTAFWRCVTDNGSGSPTVTATSVAVAADTPYAFRIECGNAANDVKFYINDVLVATHTTKVPTASTLLGYGIRLTTLSAAIRNIKWSRLSLVH